MCLYPKLIQNRKYLANKKNGGNIPTVLDERCLHVSVGCGKCIECTRKKRSQWMVRLMEDIKVNTNAKFITLTFSNEKYKHHADIVINETWIEINKLLNSKGGLEDKQKLIEEKKKSIKGYDLDNKIAKKAVRLFLERWRKKYKKSLRHFLVTELGDSKTDHLHLHGIVWSYDISELKNIWANGYVWDGKEINGNKQNFVNEKTVNYITKYITKKDEKHKEYQSIILCSAGIGKNYMESFNAKKNNFNENETYTKYKTKTGLEIALPMYYRNKLYNDEEREKLWIEQLNKQERYIMGNRIDVSKSMEEYFKGLEYYRRLNKELGYGNGKIDWKRLKYEKELRALKQALRGL